MLSLTASRGFKRVAWAVKSRVFEFEAQRPCHDLIGDQYMIVQDLTLWSKLDPMVQAHQLAGPVVGSGTGFRAHQAASRQLSTPKDEFVARQGSVGHQLVAGIDGVNLNNALCQIGTNSCHPGSWDSSFYRDFPNSQAAVLWYWFSSLINGIPAFA